MGRKLGFWRRLVVCVLKPPLLTFTRHTWSGTHHIPTSGPAIIAVNHISMADPITMSEFVYDTGRWPHFLAKASVFKFKPLGSILQTVGQIPVHRGSADAVQALVAAEKAIAKGEVVIMYPEGTITKEPNLWPMRAKTGIARLALETGAPVIPVVQWGPEQIIDPRTGKFHGKWCYNLTAAAGPPVNVDKWKGLPLTPSMLQDCADEIMYAVRDLLEEIRGEKAPDLFVPDREKS